MTDEALDTLAGLHYGEHGTPCSVSKIMLIVCLMCSIILPAAEAKAQFDIMVISYLAHATPTPELKELVTAMMVPGQLLFRYFDPITVKYYLAIIQQWVRSIKLLHFTHNDITMHTGLW